MPPPPPQEGGDEVSNLDHPIHTRGPILFTFHNFIVFT